MKRTASCEDARHFCALANDMRETWCHVQDVKQQAQEQAQPVVDNAKDMARQAKARAQEVQKEARKNAQPLIDSAQEQGRQLQSQAAQAKDAAVEKARPMVEDAKNQAQPVIDSTRQKAAEVRRAVLSYIPLRE